MPVSVYLFLSLQLLFVAYFDFKFKKISNIWLLINLITYMVLLFIFPDNYNFDWQTFTFPLAIILGGYILFILKIMGGGDSKYLFSFYLVIPVSFHEKAFLCLAYTTVLVGLSLFLNNIIQNSDKIIMALKNKNIESIKNIFGKKFSYAPAIFTSWIWFGWKIKNYLF